MSTNLSTITAPPLDLDLNSIDTSMPLLAEAIYDLLVAGVTQKSTAAGAPMLSLDLVTTAPSQAQDGSQLGAGIHVFHNLNLQPSGKSTWEIVARNIAEVVQALGVATTYGELVANPQVLMGKTARCMVACVPAGVSKTGKAFKAKNEISNWMKAQ
jgi:hypothetical protein